MFLRLRCSGEGGLLAGVGALTEGEGAKSRARNPKLETSTNDRRFNVQNGPLKARSADAGFCHLDFGPWDLFRISLLGFRICRRTGPGLSMPKGCGRQAGG